MNIDPNEIIFFRYTNHRGSTERRAVHPHRIEFRKSEWHGDAPLWLLIGYDMERKEMREFKIDCMDATDGGWQ